jgi:hypothetical protein
MTRVLGFPDRDGARRVGAATYLSGNFSLTRQQIQIAIQSAASPFGVGAEVDNVTPWGVNRTYTETGRMA